MKMCIRIDFEENQLSNLVFRNERKCSIDLGAKKSKLERFGSG